MIPINPEAIGDPNATPVVYLGEEAGKVLGIRQRSHVITVAAYAHPVIDEWVWERARSEAATRGLVLGEYLGREDTLPAWRPPDLCCHVFAAAAHLSTDRPDQPEG